MATTPLSHWVNPTFDASVAGFEKDFIKFVKKESGYPRGRAWADNLDQRIDIIAEDFARANDLAIEIEYGSSPLNVRFFKLTFHHALKFTPSK
jgi:hypothetical protein